MVCCVFPTARDDRYNAVKTLLCAQYPIPSQMINAKTIGHPGKLRSVVQKIALQMNCKLGGEAWSVKVNQKIRQFKIKLFQFVFSQDPDGHDDGVRSGRLSRSHQARPVRPWLCRFDEPADDQVVQPSQVSSGRRRNDRLAQGVLAGIAAKVLRGNKLCLNFVFFIF